MFQPLYVAATGLSAMQDEILNITNNLANAKTVAYKKGRTEMESLFFIEKSFKDQLYEAMSGTETPPVSVEYGTGVRVASTPKDFAQGSIEVTNNPLDIAIKGDGFFRFRMPDGSEVTEKLPLRMFFPEELDALLKYHGFIVERKYGDYDESPFESESPMQIVVCSLKA